MNRTTVSLIAAVMTAGATRAATTLRAPTAIQPFQALPGPDHTVRPTDLAWLDNGKVNIAVGSSSEVEAAITAPHFQVAYGQRTLEIDDPETGFYGYRRTDRPLHLSTAIALSQVGLGGDFFDLALGASFERDKRRFDTITTETGSAGIRQSADLSAAIRLGAWRATGSILDAVDIQSDAGTTSDPRMAFDLGRLEDGAPQFGARFEFPLRIGGEAGLRLGVGREFRQALHFSAEIGTTYREQTDTTAHDRSWMRRSLEASIGTSLRFRPRQTSDPDWIQVLVDPFGGSSGRILRDMQIGVQGTWDLVHAGRGALTLGRDF